MTQNVHKHDATKVTEGIFDILKIFKMAAISRLKMVILGQKLPKIVLFGLEICTILKQFKILKIPSVTFFTLYLCTFWAIFSFLPQLLDELMRFA